MSAVVADTHIVLWALLTPAKLTANAEAAIRAATEGGDPVYVSAISLIEVAYLVEKGRLYETAYTRLSDELVRPDSGLVIVAIDLPIAHTLRRIPRESVPDMPDRIIAATALHLGLPLVTRDSAIRAAGLHTIW
jgi:PIN domain nuclease of toxin-antitoxin system